MKQVKDKTQMSRGDSLTSEQSLDRGRWVYVIFILWSLFSVLIYSHFSQLGDSQAYLNGSYDDSGQARTVMITFVAATLRSLTHSDIFVNMVFAMFAALGVAYLVKHSRLRGRYRWPLLAIILNPNFGVWASVVGRESVFVCLSGFFMGAVLGYYRRRNLWQFFLALLCLLGMIFIRSAYGLGMLMFFVMFLIYTSGIKSRLGLAGQSILFSMAAILLLIFLWPYLDDYIKNDVLPKAKSYFTLASSTTRTWITMKSSGDLMASLVWSLPLALIGPTISEVIARPVMLPFMLSGLVVFAVTIYSVFVSFRTKTDSCTRKILVLGWLPATIFIIVSFVPFGIYNPGSGIRYSSCFLLFLIFPSMLYSIVSEDEGSARPVANGTRTVFPQP